MLIRHTRSAFAVMVIVMMYCAFGCITAGRVFAAIDQVERSENELLILEVHVNDTIRSRSFIAYLPEGADLNQALIPITSLSRALSFSLRADPVEGVVQGWFRKEKNIFQLDLNRNIIFVNGKESTLPDGAAEAHFEDIYVQAEMLQEWLGVKIRLDISTLRLFITSDNMFPFEEEAQRRKRGLSLGDRRSSSVFVHDPDTILPYKSWTNPSIVWQNSVQGRYGDGGKSITPNFSLQANADVLNFSSKLIVAGAMGTDTDPQINNARLLFQKRDPFNGLLGPLKAGKVSFGDVNFPDVPLIVGRKRGRGISVSSDSDYTTSRSYGAERYNVDGDAQIGWDAELYRNGYFVAFQEVGEDGRYNFEEIELVRGFNLFQIILSGPEGQKITEVQRVIRGAEMLQGGELEYDFALGQPEADFLPITDNSNVNANFGGSGRIFYGIKNYLTVGASVFTGSDLAFDSDKRSTTASLTAVTAFLGLKTQAQFMSANEGRSAYNIATTTKVLGANITAGHTSYEGFSEEDKDLVSTTSIDMNKNLGFMAASGRAEKNKYQGKEDEIVLRGTASTRIAGVQLSNSLERTLSDAVSQEDFLGDLTLRTNLWNWRLRSKLNYDLKSGVDEKLRNVNFSAIRTLNRDSTLRLNGLYDFSSNLTTADMRYTKQFKKFSLDVNLGGTTQRDYFGGLTYRIGLQPDHNGKYQVVSAREGGMGSVGLRTYLDSNGNRKYDEGDRLLPNLSFRSNHGLVDGSTGDDGSLFVNGLAENPTRFWLDSNNMPSIYLKPYDDFVTILPRSGATTTIDIGFEQLGEIDGFIYVKDEEGKDKPMPGLEILLIDINTNEEVASISSEYDGYYIFSAIPLGSYIVRALPSWDDDDIISLNVSITNETPIMTDKNIILPPRQNSFTVSAPDDADNADIKEGQSDKESIMHVVGDGAARVITDGMDIATGEPLRGAFIHVGSEEAYEDAQDERKRLWRKYPKILSPIPLYIYKIQIGDKVYYRIAGEINNVTHGKKICAALLLKKAAGGCSLMAL